MTNQNQLLRVVYFSRNAIGIDGSGITSEINKILVAAQENNSALDISGVLVFNNGVFGQVLEGPVDAVEETFERIQMDERHYDVTVLESKVVTERKFARWSMGYVGAQHIESPYFQQMATSTGFDLKNLDVEAIFSSLVTLALRNEVNELAA